MPIVDPVDLSIETASEPMDPEDVLIAIILSAQKNGSITSEEIAATCEAAGCGGILEAAKELAALEESDTDPAMDDPEPDEDDPST